MVNIYCIVVYDLLYIFTKTYNQSQDLSYNNGDLEDDLICDQ